MIILQRFWRGTAPAAALALLAALGGAVALDAQPSTDAQAALSRAEGQDKPKRPKVTLRSSPAMAFTPATLTFTAELKDGDSDFEDFYCASVEWDWADGTRSESSDDCEPYERGKSEIRRRYTIQHKYNIDGVYDVQFRLKQRGKTVALARTKVTIRPGR